MVHIGQVYHLADQTVYMSESQQPRWNMAIKARFAGKSQQQSIRDYASA